MEATNENQIIDILTDDMIIVVEDKSNEVNIPNENVKKTFLGRDAGTGD